MLNKSCLLSDRSIAAGLLSRFFSSMRTTHLVLMTLTMALLATLATIIYVHATPNNKPQKVYYIVFTK